MTQNNNNSPIQIKISKIVNEFKSLENDLHGTTAWEKKYEKLIELGKKLVPMLLNDKTDDLKLKGCQSQVWLKAHLENGRVIFVADSDAVIVKGLVALVINVYSGETPDVILQTEPSFLKDIGLDKGLSQTRTNGLNSMIKQIKNYAIAYKIMQNR